MTKFQFGLSDVSSNVFAESPNCIAIYNRSPAIRGHSLVLPKRVVPSLLQLDETDKSDLYRFAEKVTLFLLHVFECTAFDWTLQDGAAAGQTVPHVHFHILPRRYGDLEKPGDWYVAFRTTQRSDLEGAPELPADQLAAIVSELRLRWKRWALSE